MQEWAFSFMVSASLVIATASESSYPLALFTALTEFKRWMMAMDGGLSAVLPYSFLHQTA